MSETQIVELLNNLYGLLIERVELLEAASHDKELLLTPQQIEHFCEIEEQYGKANRELEHTEKFLRSEIKKAVLASGQKVRGAGLQAIPTTRAKWNGKGLDGYAVANPDILAFRSESKSVTIRKT